MKSIRWFLVMVLLASITLVLFLSALRGYRLSMAEAQRLFDNRLAASAYLLSATTSRFDDDQPGLVDAQYTAFQIWQGHQLLLRSSDTPATTPISEFRAGYGESNFARHRWRTFAFLDRPSTRWILTAERTDVRSSLAEDIILKTVVPVVFVIPGSGLLIWFIVSFGLRPLRQLSARLRDKRADDLSPLPMDEQPAELVQVVRSSNDLLRRLSASFEQQKRFTADAAHEFRTPVSALKIHLHNLLQADPGDRLVAHQASLRELDASVIRLGRLIEQLLLLYRTAPDQFSNRMKLLDLHALVQGVMVDMYKDFDQSGISLELVGGPCQLHGDPFALETLVKNLLSNACKYTPDQGTVMVRVKPLADGVQLQIEDSGRGVPESLYDRLFDRFFRTNGDRAGEKIPGCGLGLAIVRHIVDLHHARIKLTPSSFDTGLCVTVTFPPATDNNGNTGKRR